MLLPLNCLPAAPGWLQNLLARADPLCNVVSSQLEAAQRHFRQLDSSQ